MRFFPSDFHQRKRKREVYKLVSLSYTEHKFKWVWAAVTDLSWIICSRAVWVIVDRKHAPHRRRLSECRRRVRGECRRTEQTDNMHREAIARNYHKSASKFLQRTLLLVLWFDSVQVRFDANLTDFQRGLLRCSIDWLTDWLLAV